MKFHSNLSRRIEKSVDNASIPALLFFLASGVFICGIIFFVLTLFGEGIESTGEAVKISIYDSIYFSVVTISSLGYGDFKPVGIGRIVAGIEVLYGLVMLALFVAKLAGNRQASIVKAYYINDQVYRVQRFRSDLAVCREAMSEVLRGDKKTLTTRTIDSMYEQVVTLKKYITLQQSLDMLGSPEIASELNRITQELLKAGKEILLISRQHPLTYMRRRHYEGLAKYCFKVAIRCSIHTDSSKIIEAKQYIDDEWEKQNKVRHLLPKKSSGPSPRNKISINEELIESVRKSLPPQPWPKNVHKNIASDLKISNTKSHKVISILIERGELKSQWQGQVLK